VTPPPAGGGGVRGSDGSSLSAGPSSTSDTVSVS
jgi:hypothetical protein